MKIIIETIPSSLQRYDTEGDWYIDKEGSLQIRVNEDPDKPRDELCTILHEMVEALLCIERGIYHDQVDMFDMQIHPTFGLPDDAEPGDHPEAPYRKEHRFAAIMEHLFALELGLVGYGVVK